MLEFVRDRPNMCYTFGMQELRNVALALARHVFFHTFGMISTRLRH